MQIRRTPPVTPSGAPFTVTIWMVETGPFSQKVFETRKVSPLYRYQTPCGRWSTEVTIFDSHITEAGKEAARVTMSNALLATSMTIRQKHTLILNPERTTGGTYLNRARLAQGIWLTSRTILNTR